MIAAIETYLAMRRTAGFTLSNTEYLLRSFADFATNQKQTHIRIAHHHSSGLAKQDQSRNAMSATRLCASLPSTCA